MNTVIHLLLQLNIGTEHGFWHISASMTLDFSYFEIKRPLSNCSFRKQTGIKIFLTLGVNILSSTTDIQVVLSYQCTVRVLVCNAKAPMYLRIIFVFLTVLYIHIIHPPVESDDISG